MIAHVYFNSGALPPSQDGWIKAASAYGNFTGQLLFGVLADILGRKKMYGVELIILCVGALGCAFTPSIALLPVLGMWRFILGVGVGGDYPVSGVIASEFASTKNRGTMIALVFAMQGIGILLGAVVSTVALAAFKTSIESNVQNLDYVWRILAGFGIVPALCAVYYRMTITETPRFTLEVQKDVDQASKDAQKFLTKDKGSQALASTSITTAEISIELTVIPSDAPAPAAHINTTVTENNGTTTSVLKNKGFVQEFVAHFGQWSNLKVLIGTSLCWFLLDVGYYGTNLNTSIVLSAIGYSNKSTPFTDVWTNTVGTLIIALCGNVPGYFFTAYFVDKWGRKPIQLMGFGMLTLSFIVMAGAYTPLITNWRSLFVAIYSVAQFFFNFGK